MSDRTFVDTNVLVYAVDTADSRKQEVAKSLLRPGSGSDAVTLVLSTQVLAEFYVTVTRKLAKPLPEAAAEESVRKLAELPMVLTDEALVLAGVARSRRDQLSLWDALIVEAALAGGCDRLWSEDLQHGQRFGRLVVENPFR
jgi:predicted nucleic acid-binding protein